MWRKVFIMKPLFRFGTLAAILIGLVSAPAFGQRGSHGGGGYGGHGGYGGNYGGHGGGYYGGHGGGYHGYGGYGGWGWGGFALGLPLPAWPTRAPLPGYSYYGSTYYPRTHGPGVCSATDVCGTAIRCGASQRSELVLLQRKQGVLPVCKDMQSGLGDCPDGTTR